MTGNDSAMSHCPGHDDRIASLSVGGGRDGRCVVHCHAGCSAEDVLAAIGLQLADLFPEDPKKESGDPKSTTVYRYFGADGTPLYDQVRDDFANGTKKIWTRYANGKTSK